MGGAKMKAIVKIEIILLVLVVLVAAGMILASEGVFALFFAPEVAEYDSLPVPEEDVFMPPQATEPWEEETGEKDWDNWQITATEYFLYDIRREENLSQKGEGDKRIYPASITKLLTCYTLLQHMQPDAKITVGDAMELVQFDSSIAELQEGDVITVERLVEAMLMVSGNDAAQVAAVAAGRSLAGDSSLSAEAAVEVFAREMNRQAEALGMKNSHFVNPDGFHHDDHYTTMDDLVILCRTVLTNQTILKYVGLLSDAVEFPDRTLKWYNTNLFLYEDLGFYMPNALGLKTGYTEQAGNCLVSAFFREDTVWIIGVFGCASGNENRYKDTLAIYNSI